MFEKSKLKAQMALLNISGKQIAEYLGINESTFYRKMNNDGDFSRKEINQMIILLKIENPEEIFFAKELA